ncbi:MAG TPA: hypothetical protein VK537_06200 [Galbitalea sp.]|nr:hypothetical protein [Galbitalea sp.]
MILQDDLRQCCAFLYVDTGGGRIPLGTAFFYCDSAGRGLPGYLYLVTARHTLEGARRAGHSKIWVRVNTSESASPDRAPAEWYEVSLDEFLGHPDDDDDPILGIDWLERREDRLRIDLAAMWFPGDPEVWMWPGWLVVNPQVVEDENVRAGADLVITGLYRNHHGDKRNIPIVRTGTLSAMPEEPVDTKLGPSMVCLVEARSIGGLSGSPVYLMSEEWVWPRGESPANGLTRRGGFQVWLLGVIHGHFDSRESETWDLGLGWGKERMNEGIAMVTPAYQLEALFLREEFTKKRKPLENIGPEGATLDTLPIEPALTKGGVDSALAAATKILSTEGFDSGPEDSGT